jgi:hypothetical protein
MRVPILLRERAMTIRYKAGRHKAAAAALAAVGALVAGQAVADYRFAAAPQTDLNRVYRVDTFTGEVGACQYAVQDGNIGVTLCFPAGEGAGPQDPGEYDLIASNHTREGGVFRVERRTGRMSVCYIREERVVCTTTSR